MLYAMFEELLILSNPKFVEYSHFVCKSRFQKMKRFLAKQQEDYKRFEDMVKRKESENK